LSCSSSFEQQKNKVNTKRLLTFCPLTGDVRRPFIGFWPVSRIIFGVNWRNVRVNPARLGNGLISNNLHLALGEEHGIRIICTGFTFLYVGG
jgi:hypothetical protein